MGKGGRRVRIAARMDAKELCMSQSVNTCGFKERERERERGGGGYTRFYTCRPSGSPAFALCKIQQAPDVEYTHACRGPDTYSTLCHLPSLSVVQNAIGALPRNVQPHDLDTYPTLTSASPPA